MQLNAFLLALDRLSVFAMHLVRSFCVPYPYLGFGSTIGTVGDLRPVTVVSIAVLAAIFDLYVKCTAGSCMSYRYCV